MSGVRLALAVAVTMAAFAANSLLNRAAVDGGHADPLTFAVVRVLAGAAMLALLVVLSGRRPRVPPPVRLASAAALALYLLGFSVAYVHLDAGLGALILFGGVQAMMFAAAVLSGEAVGPRRWTGAAAALLGLAVLCWPAAGTGAAPLGVAAMLAAALGWGSYTLLGRRAADPLPETAAAFLLAIPMVWLPVLLLPVDPEGRAAPTALGWALAVVSGAVTSGLGYALWYAVLPRLASTTAGLVQLSAPLLAVLGGAALLGEVPGPRVAVAAVLITGGIAFGLAQRRIGSSGS